VPPAVQKYQNQLLQLIEKQIDKKPKAARNSAHLNIKFSDKPEKPSQNPEALKSSN